MSLVLRCLWLMEHQKPISAQCDTFLRIWVCQGHINIINEQEAYWRETEWWKECKEANRKAIFIFVSNMMYIYLWWWWLLQRSHWVMERHFVPRDLMWLPTISLAHRYKWMAAPFFFFFFSKSIWKITSPFALSCPVAKNLEVYKGNFASMWRQLYLSAYVALLGLET